MKKVLMIAYQFPPMGGPGVQRTTKFVKFINEFGWEPIVFTRDVGNMDIKDDTLLTDVPQNTKIVRTKHYDLTELPGVFKLFGKVISRKVLIPDGERLWQLFSVKKAIEIIEKEKIDLIYSTSYPYSDHLLALELKKKFPDIPWVSDFRDEWCSNPYLLDNPHYKMRMNIEKNMEKNVLTNSDYVITNTPIMRDNFVKEYPFSKDKFFVIPNGFDKDDFKGLTKNKTSNEKFTITYTGSFYGRRKPDVFFEAISDLIMDNIISKDEISIKLIGNYIVSKLNAMIDNNNLQGIVEVLPYMEHKQSIGQLLKSDTLLLIIGQGPGAEAFYTGKVFEYMFTGQPILALVPEKGVAADVIRETNTGYVSDSRDKDKIKENITLLYKGWKNKSLKLNPDWEKINRFDRKELTKELVHIFNNA